MKTEQLEYAVSKYGTPLYLFDIEILKEETERIRKNLGSHIGLCYAMKANPFITEYMARMTDRIEVCSRGEFEVCRELGIPAEKMLISGVLKKKEDLFRILDICEGKCACTVESVRQFHYLAEWSDAHSVKLRLYMRLTGGDQFGMDETTFRNIIGLINMSESLELEGLHYFTGTRKKSLLRLKKELDYVDGFLTRLKEEMNCDIRHLEYGPGIAVPYFEGEDPETFTDEGIRELGRMISEMHWKGTVTVEMGRAFAARCGYYMTQIFDVKTNGNRNYCIVDGGNHHLNYDGQIKGMYKPNMRILPDDSREAVREWNICGALCTVNDVLAAKVPLSGVRTGKVLVFEHTGAYSSMEGMSLFLSHALPPVAAWEKENGWKLMRRRTETYTMNMPGHTAFSTI